MKTFNFHCEKCHRDFSIDLEEVNPDDFLSVPKQTKVFCVGCGNLAKCMGSQSLSKIKKLHINQEASAYAIRQATDQKRIDNEVGDNKMIPVVSTEGRQKGQTEMIPEKTIKKIEEKLEFEYEK